jgi:hypothetical protein
MASSMAKKPDKHAFRWLYRSAGEKGIEAIEQVCHAIYAFSVLLMFHSAVKALAASAMACCSPICAFRS